jgi:hypothetical protein
MWVERVAPRALLLVWTIFCVLVGAPLTAHAFEVKTTPSGLPVYWAPSSVPFQLDPSTQSLTAAGSVAIGTAVQAWSGSGGGPSLTVEPASSHSKPAVDGNNVIYFAPTGSPLAPGALAITILTYDDTTGHILDADIVINGTYAFGVLPVGSTPSPDAPQIANDAEDVGGASGSASMGTFDIAHVVAHETGHALGMSDEMRSHTPLMFLYTQPGDATRRMPTSDDLAGIAELYADAGAGRGCSSSTMSPRRPRASAWCLMGGIVLLGVVFLRLRRRTSLRQFGFVAALAVIGAPSISGSHRLSVDHAPRSGDARATVVAARAAEQSGPWQTEVSLTVVECRIAKCPSEATVTLWGGHRGNVVQEVGEGRPPQVGDQVEVTVSDGQEVRLVLPPSL